MKVISALDSFKGSMSSIELSNIVEKGIKKIYPTAKVEKIPLADGGEGTVEALVSSTNGKIIEIMGTDPLGRKINTNYGILGDGKTAVIEMAKASGLDLLKEEERNPLLTTTYGTGELIADAIKKGYRKIIIGLGGSSTNDAGVGMLQALGFKFLDSYNNELGMGGKELNKIKFIDKSNVIKNLDKCKFEIACDVKNPLYGKNGAAYIYGKQKGATEKMIEELDLGLRNFAKIVSRTENKKIDNIAGAGAAGGLGGGILAFLNSELKSGVDIVIKNSHLEDKLKDADFLITGEGKIDNQSNMGKAPIGVAKLAKKYGVPVIGLAGSIGKNIEQLHEEGLTAAFSIIKEPILLKEAMKKDVTENFLQKSVEELFRLIKSIKKL